MGTVSVVNFLPSFSKETLQVMNKIVNLGEIANTYKRVDPSVFTECILRLPKLVIAVILPQ